MLVQVGSDPFLGRVAELLAEQIKTNRIIDELKVASPAELPKDGSLAPDVFIILELANLEKSGFVNQETKTVFHLSLGNHPWRSRSSYHDSTSPPIVDHDWTATLDMESSFSGIRTHGDRALAQDIAGQLIKAMSNQVVSLTEKVAPMPELPAELYGPYEPVPDFSFLKDLKAERVASYHGMLTHNETFWKFTVPGDPGSVFKELTGKAEAQGWKNYNESMTNHVRLRQTPEGELEIFPVDRQYAEAGSVPPETREFIVHYRKAFSSEKREAAMEQLMALQPGVDSLLPFENIFTPAQRARLYSMIEQAPVMSPKGVLRLAEIRLRKKDTNGAIAMLKRAKALESTMDSAEASSLQSEIKDLGKKISPKRALDLELSAEDYRSGGFVDLTESKATVEVERALGEPFLCFATASHGIETLGFTVRALRGGSYPYVATQTRQGGRSGMSSSFVPGSPDQKHSFAIAGRTLEFAFFVDPDRKKVRYKANWK
jgi:hypothetical protein